MKTTVIKREHPFPKLLGNPWALLNDKGLPFGFYPTEAKAKAMQRDLALIGEPHDGHD